MFRNLGFCTLRATIMSVLMVANPALAQDSQSSAGQTSGDLTSVGRVADSPVGEIGQRQTKQETQGIRPMARISSRIQNRVQLRLRNRIDRAYRPQTDMSNPFMVADDQARTAGATR